MRVNTASPSTKCDIPFHDVLGDGCESEVAALFSKFFVQLFVGGAADVGDAREVLSADDLAKARGAPRQGILVPRRIATDAIVKQSIRRERGFLVRKLALKTGCLEESDGTIDSICAQKFSIASDNFVVENDDRYPIDLDPKIQRIDIEKAVADS